MQVRPYGRCLSGAWVESGVPKLELGNEENAGPLLRKAPKQSLGTRKQLLEGGTQVSP